MAFRKHRVRIALVLFILAVAGVVLASCGADPNAASGSGTDGKGTQNNCATPQPGCPCDSGGTKRDCGKFVERSGDHVLCTRGEMTCDGTRWGECDHAKITTRYLPTLPGPSTSSIRPLALSDSGTCPVADANDPLSNVCDPYCHQYIDDPFGPFVTDSGLVVDEAGLTAPGGGGADGGVPVPFQVSANGDSLCTGGTNLHTNPCDATNQYTQCQQDYHCNIATNSCVWNGGEGYFDPAAGGVDLTIGAACDGTGLGTLVPVCNRGSDPVPPNTLINVHVGASTPAPDSCTPPGSVSCSRDVGPGGLLPGKCMSVPCNIPGTKYAIVTATPAVTEPGGRCSNNQAYVKQDGSGCATCGTCNTRLQGTLYDPRGANPIPNGLVYVPATTPAAMPTTVGCDTCVGLATGTPLTSATTNFDGTFTLDNVPAGRPFNLVLLAGRWRRQVTVPAITACTTGTLSNALRTLPKNSGEGDIPKTAIVMAEGDHTECLMRQIGVDDSEFTNAAGSGRIHLYSHNGHTFAGATAGNTTLYSVPATMNQYSAIMAPCDNTTGPQASFQPTTTPPTHYTNATERANVAAYLDSGGRLFASHWFSVDFVHTPYPSAATHLFGNRVDNDREAPSFRFTIDTGHAAGLTFANWANLVGASPGGFGTVTFSSWRHLTEAVGPGTVRFAYGDSTQPPLNRTQAAPPATSIWGGPIVSIFGFDTPVGGPACGRAMIPMSHVTGGTNGVFPGACGSAATGMTPQQKAFEFLVFYSQACLGPPPTPVVPPPPPNKPILYYYRDFEGVCPEGAYPRWGYFYWQSLTPGTTSIDFSAATADDPSTFLPAPPPAAPAAVPIGSANGADVLPPNWQWDTGAPPAGTVDWHLRNEAPGPPQVSRRWLRVYMRFNPSGPVAPTLIGWRQQFSCVPSE